MNQRKKHCQLICHVQKKTYLPISRGQKYSYILVFEILLALKSRITDLGERNDLLLLFYKGAIFSQLSDDDDDDDDYYCFSILSSSVVVIWVLLAVSAAFRSLETQHWLTTAHFQKCRADLTSPITRHWHSSRQFQGHQSKWVLLPLSWLFIRRT